ncbi:MAG: hypothetical protein AAGL23_10475 [Pseudomonadota bacterium]
MLHSFDHDDFKKARKALFVSAVTTIIVSSTTISDGKISVSNVQVTFAQNDVLFWLKLGVIYFLFIFGVRLFQEINQQQISRVEAGIQFRKSLENAGAFDSASDGFFSETDSFPKTNDEVETLKFLEKMRFKAVLREQYAFILSDVLPAFCTALYALRDFHTVFF